MMQPKWQTKEREMTQLLWSASRLYVLGKLLGIFPQFSFRAENVTIWDAKLYLKALNTFQTIPFLQELIDYQAGGSLTLGGFGGDFRDIQVNKLAFRNHLLVGKSSK